MQTRDAANQRAETIRTTVTTTVKAAVAGDAKGVAGVAYSAGLTFDELTSLQLQSAWSLPTLCQVAAALTTPLVITIAAT